MEKSWYNPIALLRSSVQSALEHITDQFSTELKQAIIDARISITSGGPPSPIKTPTANLENHEIKIQDAYIAFLWCFSYATVAINSILYQNADQESGIVTFNGNPDFPKVQLTLGRAKSLQKKVTLWPEEAARPDRPDKWTEAATNLSQACIAYLFFHEMCHVLRHSELSSLMRERSENPYCITSESDCNKIFNAEVEADQFALDCLMENSDSEEGNLIRFLGASLAHLTNFYLLDSPDIRGGKTHPDLDDRLKAVLKKVHFQEQANQIQFRMHILAGLQLYMHLTEAFFLLEELQKFNFIEIEDFEKRFFELIGKMKNAARGKSD